MKILALDDLIICEGEGQNDWYSLSNDVMGLPAVRAHLARRSGRHPLIGNIERGGRQFTIETYFPNDAIKTSKQQLLALLNARESVRVLGGDYGIGDALLMLGPWDVYDDDGTLKARDIVRPDDYEATISGAFHPVAGPWGGGQAPIVEEATTNYLRNPVCANTTYWASAESSLSLVEADIFTNGTAVNCIANTSAGNWYAYQRTESMSLTSGDKWTATVRVRASASMAAQISLYRNWTLLNSETVTLQRRWQTFHVTGTMDSTVTDNLGIFIDPSVAANGQWVLIDWVQIEKKPYPTTLAWGGAGTGYVWSGTAHSSTSSRTATSITFDPTQAVSTTLNSLSIWFQMPHDAGTSDLTTARGLFSWWDSYNTESLYIQFSQALEYVNIISYKSSVKQVDISASLIGSAQGDWHHIVVTWNSSQNRLRLYLDGTLRATSSYAPPVIADVTAYLGFVTERFGGALGEIATMNAELTAEEVAALYQAHINPRWLNAVCLDASPLMHERNATDYAMSLLMQIDGDVAWRQRDADYVEWDIAETGDTITLDNDGDIEAYPVFSITPTSAKTAGFTKARWIPVKWRSDNAAARYPIDLSNDGLNLSADAQADGDDIRVYSNGIEIDRWLAGTLVTDVKIWANFDFAAAVDMTLAAGIDSDDTSLTVNEAIDNLPDIGIVMIGSEALVYTERNARTKTLSGLTRGVRGTTAASHSASADVYWIQHDVWIYYGDSSLTTPTVDDDYKPIFNLNTSTNASWVYAEFGENDGLRAGQWSQGDQFAGADRGAYTANHGTDADPWTEIGWETDQPNYGFFYLYNPCSITQAAFTNGEAYYNIVAGGNSHDLGVASSNNGFASFTKEYTHTFSAEDTWEAWSDTVNPSPYALWVGLYGYADFEEAWIEASNVTVTINSDYRPIAAPGSAQTVYELDCTIANGATGQSLRLTTVVGLNSTLIVDTDNRTITLSSGSGRLSAKTLDSVRTEWLPLDPGENTLTFTDVGTTGVEITITWDRRYVE